MKLNKKKHGSFISDAFTILLFYLIEKKYMVTREQEVDHNLH